MSEPRLLEAGDSALLLQLEPVIDPAVNAHAIAIADAIRSRDLSGVLDVVSTFRSVAVYFDPLKADAAEISRALREGARTVPVLAAGRRHQIPVAYGADDGPDLDEIAARARLGRSQVIARHSAIDYRVFMLGFQPGFAYMGLVDPSIASPRRESPRLRVPAGSVGIAGRQTGVYASSTPGGWQIVGRALEPVFDATKTPPARFAPGDTVTFRPARADSRAPLADRSSPSLPAPGGVTVLRPGLFTTVQDAGVWGNQRFGVPVSGAMDTFSHAAANLVVGNSRHESSLEATIAGPELRFDARATIALAGADMGATVDGVAVPMQTPVLCPAGSVLALGSRRRGARTYIAIAGGIEPDRRYPARPITAAQALAVGASRTTIVRGRRPMVPVMPSGGARLRVLPGPQLDELPDGCLDGVCANRFTVSPQSNRVGYRLTGAVGVPSRAGDMISDATFPGAIQIPPSGEPILLMADRQTTGGYPQVAIVISADLPMAGQLAPGDWVEFELCSREEARRALLAREGVLTGGA